MAESLLHWGATLWGSSYCHCSREAQPTVPTERFYKSVRPRSQVRRYKTLYLWWLRLTIHRKNRPCRSFEDPQEVESETGAYTSSRLETPSSPHAISSFCVKLLIKRQTKRHTKSKMETAHSLSIKIGKLISETNEMKWNESTVI